MPLALDDGYTLPFATSADGPLNPTTGRPSATGLPVVTGRYRPAVFAEVQEFQYRFGRSPTGKEQAAAVAELVAGHVTDWDVTLKGGAAPVTAENVLRMPDPIVNQLLDTVTRWGVKDQDAAAGNSGAG